MFVFAAEPSTQPGGAGTKVERAVGSLSGRRREKLAKLGRTRFGFRLSRLVAGRFGLPYDPKIISGTGCSRFPAGRRWVPP